MDVSPPRLGAMFPNRLLVVLGAALFVIATGFLLDDPAHDLAASIRVPMLDAVVAVLNPIGSGVTLLVVCAGLAVLCRARQRARGSGACWAGALAFMAAGLVEYSLKHLVGRARPAAAGPFLPPELDSFPSGHATSVFAVATILAAFYPRLRWPLYSLAAAIALGRVYLARHYMSDILAGALIGVAIALLVLRHRGASAAPAVRPT